MNSGIDENRSLIAATADVTSFFHELDVSFMLDESLVDEARSARGGGLIIEGLHDDDDDLHALFISALEQWGIRNGGGLPVGLTASALIANIALLDFDRLIEREFAPRHYGRYVDDVIIVMENGAQHVDAQSFWKWISDRSGSSIELLNKTDLRFSGRTAKSEIVFKNDKNRVYKLEGKAGKALIGSISKQIQERASEWRLLQALPRNGNDIMSGIVAATQGDGEPVDSLRKTDDLSIRRAAFALSLRDMEAYERNLEPGAWIEYREAFYEACVDHVLVMPEYFSFASYLPRILRMAIACWDITALRRLIEALTTIHYTLAFEVDINENSSDLSARDRWTEYARSQLRDSIAGAFPRSLTAAQTNEWAKLSRYIANESPFDGDWSQSAMTSTAASLFARDLGHVPYRIALMPRELRPTRERLHRTRKLATSVPTNLLDDAIFDGAASLSELGVVSDSWRKQMPGLLLATRPLNLLELYILSEDPFDKNAAELVGKAILGMRGYLPKREIPRRTSERDIHDTGATVVNVGIPNRKSARTIALANLHTSVESWEQSLTSNPDTSLARYHHFVRLVNEVVALPESPDYLVLPELALPARWFLGFALKLQHYEINLISGIEYSRSREDEGHVHNQVWAALGVNDDDFRMTVAYRQDKQNAALHEGRHIRGIAGVTMQPERPWSEPGPPVICHNGFCFAVIVCSELTSINYRSWIRGRVDALIVPEWNKDTLSFEPIVESAAGDVHAYIVQCNHRAFGDSRIRAPFKAAYQRDVLKLKGGVHDYTVMGSIDIESLRKFQSYTESPAGPYKPVPDGYRISKYRYRMP